MHIAVAFRGRRNVLTASRLDFLVSCFPLLVVVASWVGLCFIFLMLTLRRLLSPVTCLGCYMGFEVPLFGLHVVLPLPGIQIMRTVLMSMRLRDLVFFVSFSYQILFR